MGIGRRSAIWLVACTMLALTAIWGGAGAGAQPARTTPAASTAVPAIGGAAPAQAEPTSGTAANTGGKAKKAPVVANVTLLERWQSGGNTMWFILLASIVVVASSLERIVGLRRSIIFPAGLVDQAKRLWAENRFDELYALCEQRPSTLSAIVQTFVRHRTSPLQDLSVLAADIAGRDMRAHLQKAYPIAVAATLSPLLGLFGTVIGMIEAFEIVAIAGSLGDASLLAGSISKALITTAAGLMVAIPALAAYHFFRGRTNNLTMGLEGDVNELLTAWFMDHAPTVEPVQVADEVAGSARP